MTSIRPATLTASALPLIASCTIMAGAIPPGGGGGGTTPPPDPAIAYVDSGIKVMNADGTNQRTVVSLRRGELVRSSSWSADSTQLAFWGHIGGVAGIRTVPVAGGASRFVTATSGTQIGGGPAQTAWPEWSPAPTPDGTFKIVFTDYVPATPFTNPTDIFVVNPDGTGRINLTNTPSQHEIWAAWSRDGQHIIAVRGADLVVYSLGIVDGQFGIVGETVVYTDASNSLAFPRWANTSDWVTFSVPVSGLRRVVMLDLANPAAVPVLLTSSPTTDERWSSFSPDDSRLAYSRAGASGGIYVINSNGTGEVRINNRGLDPCWRRTP